MYAYICSRQKYISCVMLALFASLILVLISMSPASAASRKLVLKEEAKSGTENRVALVIGNSNYESQEVPKLPNPTNDARAMAEALNKLGFVVTELTNANYKEMRRAISIFSESFTNPKNTVALFYYAGHGLQVNGKNYLIPVDAEISNQAAVSSEAVAMDTVIDQLRESSVSIVILDACRNNPFKKTRSIGGGGGWAPLQAAKGTLIAYATAPGQTASDGTGTNGLYTQELLKSINTKGISVEEVFKRVRSNVSKATNEDQIPWEESSLTGSFYFNGAPILTNDNEIAYWERIKNSKSIAEFDTYLVQYPNGKFVKDAEVAKARLEEKERNEQALRVEDEARLAAIHQEETRKLELERLRLEQEKYRIEREGAERHSSEPAPYVPPAF